MPDVPDHPNPQTRTAVTARITAHVTQGWPHLGIPDVTYRGQFCYVAASAPGDPAPALPRISRPQGHRDLPRQRPALHRGRAAHLLRTQDRNPRTGHRPHLHPLRRPQPPALTASRRPRTAKHKGDLPPHQNTVGTVTRRTFKRAGVTGYTLHSLRHFFASGLIAAGCDVVTVQKAMGHSSAATTLRVYAHLWPTAEDRTREAVADLMQNVDEPRSEATGRQHGDRPGF